MFLMISSQVFPCVKLEWVLTYVLHSLYKKFDGENDKWSPVAGGYLTIFTIGQ